MGRELTIVDVGLGNLASAERALHQVGAAVTITSDPDVIATSRMLVFPGQGAFGAMTDDIVNGAIGAAIKVVIERGDPFLGICLGMQLLFEGSAESDGRLGLGILPGRCRRFPLNMTEPGSDRRLKVPHMGWNDVSPGGDHYYFVHSYYVPAEECPDLMWSTTYGDVTLAAAVRRDNIYGCQFHPEKSQNAGLKFLRGFILGGRGT